MLSLLRVFYVFIILCIAVACVREKRLDEIDSQLEKNNIVEARRLLKTELQLFQDDSLYSRQLKHRLRKIDRKMLFSIYDSLSDENRTRAAAKALQNARKKIANKHPVEQRWYLYDYYLRKGRQLQQSNSVHWRDTLGRAVEFPAEKPRQKTELMFELAFSYADSGEFIEARKWMDKAMRTFEPPYVRGPYMQIYGHYMDGRFAKAESLLKNQKNNHYPWAHVQRFLNSHGDSLSLEDRFKLW